MSGSCTELDAGFFVKRGGWRLIYDPAIGVNHHQSARTWGVARSHPDVCYDFSHNYTYVILKHISWPRKLCSLVYFVLVGQRRAWGLLSILIDPVLTGELRWWGQLGPTLPGPDRGGAELSREPARAPSSPVSAPLVSVIVPAHDAGSTVVDTLESVRRQTVTDLEVIVIDDGSTDDTVARVARVTDPRITLASFPGAGSSTARNRGMGRARGAFLSFLDADDLWTPDKLELQLEALRRRADAGVAYSWTYEIDPAGRPLGRQPPVRHEGDVYAPMLLGFFLGSRLQRPAPARGDRDGGAVRSRAAGGRGLGVFPARGGALAVRGRAPLPDPLPAVAALAVLARRGDAGAVPPGGRAGVCLRARPPPGAQAADPGQRPSLSGPDARSRGRRAPGVSSARDTAWPKRCASIRGSS